MKLWYNFKYRFPVWKEKTQMSIAWMMPHWLVKMCCVRVISHASTTDYSSVNMHDISAFDAYKSWCDKNK